MIDFDAAAGLIARNAQPLETEPVALDAALGRRLAAPVVARVSAPPVNVSAMDGYAVIGDPAPGDRLAVIGTSWPGSGFDGALAAGQAVRIFTGAPVPQAATRIIIQENVLRDGDDIVLTDDYGPPAHIRRAGHDFRAGDGLLQPGRLLDPYALVVLAGADHDGATVYRRPRVSVLGTGDELLPPGRISGAGEASPSAIPDSVSFGVAAAVQAWGGELVSRQIAPDSEPVIRAAAQDALAHSDVLVMIGGASVGEKDFAKKVLGDLGLDMIFSKVAIKPGKPVWLGRAGDCLVLGLPGNPVSAMVTARLFLAPLLHGLGGGDAAMAWNWQPMALAAPIGACGGRETFTRAASGPDGLTALSNQDSGAQRSLADADYLVRQRADTPGLDAGAQVGALPMAWAPR